MEDDVIERKGDYYLQKCDSMYQAYSGYAFIVCYQPPTLCGPKQLAGFKKDELEKARKFLAKKAGAGVEQKRFEATKARVTELLDAGFMPCSDEDDEHRRYLVTQGYSVSHKSGSTIWMQPPAKGQGK